MDETLTFDRVLTRPIFFYNAPQRLGETLSLHLFEPRYRLMVARIVESHKEFVYMGHGRYGCREGDVGMLCRIEAWQILPDGRALISGVLLERFMVTAHWVEENSGDLSYCQGVVSPLAPLDGLMEEARLRQALVTYLRTLAYTERDLGGEYVAMEPRSHVFGSLPRLERGQIVAQSEPIATITLGSVVGGLELCPQTPSSLANIGLFARITSPVPGYILYSTFAKGQMWRPHTFPVSFHGVKVIACPYVLGFLLCGGDPQSVEAANLDLKQAVGPEVRLVSCTHTVQSVPLSWVCARLTRLLPPGTSLRPYLRDLRVHNTFNQTLLGQAVITHAPDLIPRRRMLELCEEWEANHDDWDVPEMELMAINPFFVNVTCDGSTFLAPSISVTVYRDQALRKLRSLAVLTSWPLIRLVYISHMNDEASFFHELPLEVVELICTYVSPEMFGK